MADPTSDKPGFFSRLFGRSAGQPREEQKPAVPAGPDAPVPPADPAADASPDASPDASLEASLGPEDAPDFANAARDLTEAPPFATSESPDRAGAASLAPELRGADLQPVEDRAAPPGEPEASVARPEAPPIVTPFGPLAEAPPPPPPEQRNWWQRLTQGMRRTSSSLSDSVTGLFTKRRLDAATLEELEDALVQADLGVRPPCASREAIAAGRYDKEIAPEEVKAILAARGREDAGAGGDAARASTGRSKPFVILMVGRERRRQDHHDRQARAEIPTAGSDGDARGRRHVPGRRHRAAQGLGRARRRAGPGAASRASDAAGLAFDALKEAPGRRHRRAPDRHGRPPAEQGRPDGGAGEDRAGAAQVRRGGCRTRRFSSSTPRSARTPSARSSSSGRRPASRAS